MTAPKASTKARTDTDETSWCKAYAAHSAVDGASRAAPEKAAGAGAPAPRKRVVVARKATGK